MVNTFSLEGCFNTKMPSCQHKFFHKEKIDGLVQHCIDSTANALELPQSCAKP